MRPHLDKRWRLAVKDISHNFDLEWDDYRHRWHIVQRRIAAPDWVIMAWCDSDGKFKPLNSQMLSDLRFAKMVASHGGYHKWTQKQQQRTLYAQEKRKEQEYDEALQAGKEVAPLLRSIADAGKNSEHGQSKFKFPGYGESHVFGGVND